MSKSRYFTALAALLVAMLACNLPSAQSNQQNPDAILTAAALTVQAQLPADTATSPSAATAPPAATATFTPLPLPTAIPATATTACDVGQFIKDVTIPDGSVFSPADNFTKTWRIQNIGSCTWSGYSVVFDNGDPMNGTSPTAIGTVPPGGFIDISVPLQAPSPTGSYRGYWRIRNASGVLIPILHGYNSQSFYVDIKVQSSGSGPFAVIHVTYALSTWSDSGHTNCPRVTASITVNSPGTVTYSWTSSSGTNSPQSLTFASAGTQSINYDWARGSVWAGTAAWVGIYVDNPNHQDFGHLDFSTACTSP